MTTPSASLSVNSATFLLVVVRSAVWNASFVASFSSKKRSNAQCQPDLLPASHARIGVVVLTIGTCRVSAVADSGTLSGGVLAPSNATAPSLLTSVRACWVATFGSDLLSSATSFTLLQPSPTFTPHEALT